MAAGKNNRLADRAQLHRAGIALLGIALAIIVLVGGGPALEKGESLGGAMDKLSLVLGESGFVQAIASDASLNETSDLIAGFEQELFAVHSFKDLRSEEQGSLVGFQMDCSGVEACQWIHDQLEEKGWIAQPTGEDAVCVYLKDKGDCTWALVSCMEVGATTSVVVQTQWKEGVKRGT